ncbi:tRNA-dihydrouridine(16/17) synthase [NAD(P)(+)] [Scedosporium apiospermum]|uniref:tRNA-dihydrouridine(16/17) synthase [NAD(P)(+)] n=1 Tax=Pseudallescheria apiosperma TaxID=563466 RepID=A0A084GHT2_PSEDA|nr:tRNA-dihydrouridine(16/17) synthase [NAD(P)(+)] [Scedosporium apiospermum]KEZ46894.1 tRNA-dihydrouridine(16/17) synthase [NAD(P)(+)] [Scedosporium apiospermum]
MAGKRDDGAPPKKAKLVGRAFYESIGSPKYILAPMVDQSEFAWRMLSRSYIPPSQKPPLLAYTPMLHARLFAETEKYRRTNFQATNPASPTSPDSPFLDGNPSIDRPLIVQFCANDPNWLLQAARLAAPHCDAVDLNLGCPQGIARKGHYGSFLQEDQDLIFRLIRTLRDELDVPVTAKIRILETREATLAYARNVLEAGASILTVHGRRREQKGHLTGLADWEVIRFLRENLPPETVLFANGNVLRHEDLDRCIEATGADGVMSAEGNLSDPGIFAVPPADGEGGREYWRGRDGKGGWRVDGVMRRYLDILHKYVAGVEPPARRPLFVPGDDEGWLVEREENGEEEGPARKKRKKEKKDYVQNGNYSAMQPHMFHLLRHLVTVHTDVRDALARSKKGDLEAYEQVLLMVERKVALGLLEYEKGKDDGFENGEGENGEDTLSEIDEELKAESSEAAIKRCKRPWWITQPIIRPLPMEALAKGSITLSKKNMAAMGVEVDVVEKTNGAGDEAAEEKPAERNQEAPTQKEEVVA